MALRLGWNPRRTPPDSPAGVATGEFRWSERGNFVGELRWAPAPNVTFRLEIAPDGRLVDWRATADTGAGLSARELRAAPVGAMARYVRAEAAFMVGIHEDSAESYERLIEEMDQSARPEHEKALAHMKALAASLDDFSDRPRTGPTGRSDLSYAAISKLYVDVISAGEQRPIRAVAQVTRLAEKTVQNHLYMARERGLLTSAGRGRAGGHLTDKAKELLNGHNQAS